MTIRPSNPKIKTDNDFTYELIFVELPFSTIDGRKSNFRQMVNIGKIESRHHCWFRKIFLYTDKSSGFVENFEYEVIGYVAQPEKGFSKFHPRRVERDLMKITGLRVKETDPKYYKNVEILFDGGNQS